VGEIGDQNAKHHWSCTQLVSFSRFLICSHTFYLVHPFQSVSFRALVSPLWELFMDKLKPQMKVQVELKITSFFSVGLLFVEAPFLLLHSLISGH